jgi:hypothetical protein
MNPRIRIHTQNIMDPQKLIRTLFIFFFPVAGQA